MPDFSEWFRLAVLPPVNEGALLHLKTASNEKETKQAAPGEGAEDPAAAGQITINQPGPRGQV